jgi:hypothetical protein
MSCASLLSHTVVSVGYSGVSLSHCIYIFLRLASRGRRLGGCLLLLNIQAFLLLSLYLNSILVD